MNSNKMKYLVLLLFTGISHALISQERHKFSFTIEYSPNFSRITNDVVNEEFKLSHNAVVRIGYKTKGSIQPTLGLGFLNTGEIERSEIGGQLGIESVQFIHSFNYLHIPIGAKINLGLVYFLPEISLGINLSNKTRQITEYSNGETEREVRDHQLNAGEFNKLSFPVSLSVGTDFRLGGKSFSTGIKGYYGLNEVVAEVPRDNHYFGAGLILAMNLF